MSAMLTDTHTHLYDRAFDPDGGGRAAVLRAVEAGVGSMIFPNVDKASVGPLMTLAAEFPGVVHMAMGLHPTELGDDWQGTVSDMLRLVDAHPGSFVAIGEIGVDLYWDKSRRDDQLEAFDCQVRAAVDRGLPVIIHCREALAEVVEVLGGIKGVRGVMHSFGGDAEDVRRVRQVADLYFGINGIVTFKNCHVSDALGEIGLDRLLLETDSPYLAPVPRRGRRNESAYLPYIAQFVADRMGLTADSLAAATTANARSLFNNINK